MAAVAAAPGLLIDVRDLVRTYRTGDVEVHALQGVSLRIEQGDFVAIMGSSGSGKSTLMNVLGCLDLPSSGRYVLEGRDVTELDEPALAQLRSERIGFVFQGYNLLARTSAEDNVALPLLYSGHFEQSSLRARQALRAVGLEGRERSSSSQLSGGQQQRVAIARALINDPALILADEPTGNLDSASADEIMGAFQKLHRERGVTIVLVTHEPGMAEFADRIVTMRDGRIVSDRRLRERAQPPPRLASLPAAIPRRAARAPRHALSLLGMALRVAARAVGRNKLRSALTMLGIFIGVAALIAMVAVGQGANAAVLAEIESLGANLLIVMPGATTASGVHAGFGSASTLTVRDAQAIEQEAPAVARVGYLIREAAQLQYASRNWNTTVQGVTPSYLEIRSWPVVAGRVLGSDDSLQAARVCVIGQTVLRSLFAPGENPVGTTILVKNVPVQVIGVLQPRGQSGFGRDEDDVVLIPFSTAETRILGSAAPSSIAANSRSLYGAAPNPFGVQPKLTGYVNLIYVQARSAGLVPRALEDVEHILTTRHHLRSDEPHDFDVRNISEITQAREDSSRVMALLLATVAGISLLVGGIGIMNILLVSVTERTREIGIRMAIGARRIHVLLQFLVEAILLASLGGACGIAAGVAVSELVSAIAGWPTLLSAPAIAGGFLFSAAVGVFFGYYPARRAAHLRPIEALRYE